MSFFRRHVVPGIGLLLGPAISIGSLILDAYSVFQMGFPVQIWVAIGLAIFFMSVVGVLYQHDQRVTGTNAAVLPTKVIDVPELPVFSPGGSTEKDNPRVFVNVTPEALMKQREGRIFTESDRLLAPYIGKWMRVSGNVRNVSCGRYSGIIWIESPSVSMTFETTWNSRLEVLGVGDKVTGLGKIDRITQFDVSLVQCEMMDD